MEIFKLLVDKWDADVNQENIAGETPFIIAAREGRKRIINMYLVEFVG